MKYKQALNESTTLSDIEDILQVPEKIYCYGKAIMNV